MSTRRIGSLEDFVRHGMNIHAVCHCGHRGVIASRRALWVFMVRRWSRERGALGRHFACSVCRRRSPRQFGPTEAAPTFPDWGPNDPDEARTMARSLRG